MSETQSKSLLKRQSVLRGEGMPQATVGTIGERIALKFNEWDGEINDEGIHMLAGMIDAKVGPLLNACRAAHTGAWLPNRVRGIVENAIANAET